MADDEYNKKLETLQQYIPFLDNMIQQLKDPTKKNREQQLKKMQSLHAMITDKKKRLKLETLVRCEDVISKLYEKVHNRPIGAPKKSINSPVLTPASPSPPRDVVAPKPLTIPTERVDGGRQLPKIDVYSSAGESLSRARSYTGIAMSSKVPDMSKPPISLEDLKTLEEDVQVKINETSLTSASLNELNNLREMISEQIHLEDIKTNSPAKKKEDSINTTVRNAFSLTKKTIQPPDKPKVKEKVVEPPKASSSQSPDKLKVKEKVVEPPKSSLTVKPKESKSEPSSETKKETKISSPVKQKILKEPASIFGSILSNIDDQILEGKKKKEERRNSFPGKDERRLSDGGKEKSKSGEKAPETKKKEEKSSSSGKDDKKADEKKSGDSKKKSEKSSSGEKSRSSNKESKSKEKSFSLSGKTSFEEKEQQLKEKLDKAPDKVTKHIISEKPGERTTETKDATKDTIIPGRISVKKDLELKPNKEAVLNENKDDSSNKAVGYRRLADKYNPKPRKQAVDPDVDKAVSDSIEEKMRTAPPKIPLINQIPEPIPPPASLLMCSQAEPEQPLPTKPLPAVLQNILNPSTTHLINSVVNHLRQTNAENEARKSPLLPTPPPPLPPNQPILLGNAPALLGNAQALLGNAPALLGNPSSLMGNPPSLMGNPPSLMGNPPSLMGNPPSLLGKPASSVVNNLMSPPPREDNFVSEYCRENFSNEDNSFNNQVPDFSNNQFGNNHQPPRPESRLRFEPPSAPEVHPNRNTRFIPPLLGDRFNESFPQNRQFSGHQPMPDLYPQPFGFNQNNHVDMQPLDYYPPNAPIPSNQYNSGPPLLSPEIPHYHNEQKPGGFGMMNNEFFGHGEEPYWRNEDRFQWDRRDQELRSNRDPRTYREYREMREARDPRVTRDNRDPREARDIRDPREARDSRDPREARDNRDPREARDSRDPRLNRDPRDRDFRDPRLKPRDSRDLERDRDRSRQRDGRLQSRDYRPSRYDSKFDRVYSRTNRDRSRSRSRSRPRETFTSPLDSLYSGKEDNRTGKGYGVQNFRIPKIKKEDESKEKEEEYGKVTSTNENLVEAEDSDMGNVVAAESDHEEENKAEEHNEPEIKDDVDKHDNVEESREPELEKMVTPEPPDITDTIKEVDSKEAEQSKVTCNQPAEPEAKPADQTILAQFFANLLGSKNKRDKKTALYSLISTFSDSFSEKELSKITKIIKADDEESSDEEVETKKESEKADEEKETTKDQTVEQTEKEDEVIKAPKTKARKRIRRISSGSPTKEDKSNEKELPKSSEPQQSEIKQPEEENVIVSVGERIKSRKRNSVSPPKPKKKCRTELDMLHEDIQDMFIRDGVLTASGKRMCRLLKDDPNALSASQQLKASPPEQSPKTRKKPMPKSKARGPNAAEVKVMKSVRVVIPKIPYNDTAQTEESPKRNLRRSVRNVAYVESDEESSAPEDTSTIGGDSVVEEEPLRDMDSDIESSDSEKGKSSQTSETNQKSKMAKRKRGKGWASGVLPSSKKKKKKQSSFDEPEENVDKTDKSVAESIATDSDGDKSYVEPDKNYYTDSVTSKSHQCKLCSYQGRFITTHYKTNHPLSEILTSRFSPAIAIEAIKDSEKNLVKYESIMRVKGGAKVKFICRFCQFETHVPPTTFYDHITTHTGEYRHVCPVCEFSAPSGKTLKSHMANTHQNEAKRIARKSYGQTIMFGYMCGECNYVQLSKTNVDEHINIFHLQKPVIYKINMSTYLDPEVEKIAEEESPNTSIEHSATESPVQKKEDPVPMVIEPEKPDEEKKMPPPQRKKPGPKPGPKSAKRRRKEMAQRKKAEVLADSDSLTDESVTSRESDSVDAQFEKEIPLEKPAAVTRRRITKELSIEEETPLPMGRSRRAAKDKAAEKLRTLMETAEGPPRKKSLTEDEPKKHQDKSKKEDIKAKLSEEAVKEPVVVDNKNKEECSEYKSEEKTEPKKEIKVVEKVPEKPKEEIKPVIKKEVEMNVFTCKTDLQEENKKIEQERLQMMEELNKSVGSRTSLNFVDKLCTRLNQTNVVVKEEPTDDLIDSLFIRTMNNQSPPVMPVLQKEKTLTTPTSAATTSQSTVTITANKKPVLEPEVTQMSKPSFDVTQKNDKLITDMIQKLKGKLASIMDDNVNSPITVEDTDYDSEGPPPLTHVNELVNVKPADGSTKTLLIGGFVRVIRNSESLMFSCLVPPCVFSTENKDAFQAHCRDAHKQSALNRPSTLCELCGMEIVPSAECTLLENLFKHIISDHADFINNESDALSSDCPPPSRVLRIRKLSGDALSIHAVKKDWEEEIDKDTTVDVDVAVADDVAAADDVEASAAVADKEENDKENKDTANASTSEAVANEPASADEPPATMVELNMSEDNPFPFKIAGVMSLAEPQPPPLAPIAKSGLQAGTQLIVKEAKLTPAELGKRRKTAKAMAKFISSVSDLYKCPHYYCLFSTNFRDFLENHLKAHKVEQDIMIPCVYCDMKTPWEHVPMHIDIRHAHCRFACSYCLYRAVVKEYVFLHQDHTHPSADYSVIALPQPKQSKKFAIADIKTDPKSLCEPYRCTAACNVEFLFDNEFKRHLFGVHKTSYVNCGYKDCTNRVQPAKMVNHWAVGHGVCVYQCGHCNTSNNDLLTMYHHFAKVHQGIQPLILVRSLSHLQEGVTLGYTAEAFKMMRKIISVPANFLDQNKPEAVTKEPPLALSRIVPAQAQYGKPAVYKPATPFAKLQVVTTIPQNVKKSVLIPNTSGLNRTITFVSTNSNMQPNAGGPSNILLIPGVSGATTLSTFVVASQSPVVTSMAAIDTPQVVPSLGAITTPASTVDDVAVTNPATLTLDGVTMQSVTTPTSTATLDNFTFPTVTTTTTALTLEAITREAVGSPVPTLPFENISTQAESTPTPTVTLEKVGANREPEGKDNAPTPESGTGNVAGAQGGELSIEHITVGDDSTLAVEDAENGDIDPLSLDMDLNDTTKTVDGDSSGDESDGSKVEKTKKTKSGLLSYQLYRCAYCEISFSNSNDFKKHASKSVACRKDEGNGKPFGCVHCSKKLKNVHALVEHIQCHGVLRYSCSLCSNKYPTATQARSHVKTRHNINQTSLTPVNPTKTNIDIDEYVVRPKLVLQQLLTNETTPVEPSAGFSPSENVYTPDQIDKIPMRHILSSSVKCGLCTYSTKVRTNMVRHLQFHLEEKAVSESAPVNPVPCLEKNEKMFDKMVNLASSSHASSRMGGTKTENKEKESENLPEFVQTHCRYVCPAQGCNYLCPEEANLRHHILALHDNETSFICVHCKASLSHGEADNIIKHFKLHGLQLYKCQYCSFVHNLKHKVEKHIADLHLDLPVKVITVRCLESEPKDQEPSTSGAQSQHTPASTKIVKPWRCCMCKYKSSTQEGIQQHVLEKHEIDAQFKCALCTYKNNDKDSFTEHFKDAHNNQTVDIIYAYRKLEDKEKESSEAFDTTPLWQRDRPRVRHIRGILFDESSPVVTKSPKKTSKTAGSPAATLQKPSPSTSKNSNLDLSIESVANGTADILKDASATFKISSSDFIETVAKFAKDTGEYIDTSKTKTPDDDVIVIDDDDDKDVPVTKNKDNKNAPVAKNRSAKRKAIEVPGISKIPKLSDEIIDLDSNGSDSEQDEFSQKSLQLSFGGFGTPLNRQLKCPVCNQFKSKRISDFIFHLFKEMKVYRFKCKICADESITFRYMHKHVQEHNQNIDCDENIIFLPPNRRLEAWLQIVIREQSLTILRNFSPTPDPNVSSSNKFVACKHCNRKYQSEQERNEHSIAHWSLKPYNCGKCKFSSYNMKDVEKHLEATHFSKNLLQNLSQYIVVKAPTVANELKSSDETHMKEVQSSFAQAYACENFVVEEEDPLRVPETDEVSEAPDEVTAPPTEVIPIAKEVPSETKVDDGELCESDLFIVTKTDSNVPKETDVFCCEYCPFMTNSETLVLSHITSVHEHMHIKFKTLNRVTCEANIRDYVGCMLCPEVGSEIRIRQHHLEKHDGQTFVLYRYSCSLCPKKFLKITGLKMHFKKQHTGFPLKYVGLNIEAPPSAPAEKAPAAQSTRAPPPSKSQNPKCYKCPLCSYERVFNSSSVSNVRAHVKQHFKSFTCGVCGTHKFRTRWEAMSHFAKEHRGAPEDIVQDMVVFKQFNETMLQIINDAKPVPESGAVGAQEPSVKPTARKSTSAPIRRAVVEEYSFYGREPEPVDLAKIMTQVEVNGMSLNMSADRLSKIFDLNAHVEVEDCNLSINLTTLFDS